MPRSILLSTRAPNVKGVAAAIARYCKKLKVMPTLSYGLASGGYYHSVELMALASKNLDELSKTHDSYFSLRGINSLLIDVSNVTLYEYTIGLPSIDDRDIILRHITELDGNLLAHECRQLSPAAHTGYIEHQFFAMVEGFGAAMHEEFCFRVLQESIFEFIRGELVNLTDPESQDKLVSFALSRWL